MQLMKITSGPLRMNTYILSDPETGTAAIVDPGQHNASLQKFIKENKFLNYKYVIATHGHYDHTVDIAAVKRLLPGIQVVIHKNDERALHDDSVSRFMFHSNRESEKVYADIMLEGGEKLYLGDSYMQIIHTPGHTPGGICILFDSSILTGDTLFYRNIGRTDLGGGDYDQLIDSVKKLYALEGDYDVYPGHEDQTLLSDERKYNPYIRAK